MTELLSVPVLLAACGYVLYPLFRGDEAIARSSKSEALNDRRAALGQLLDDLAFDLADGKLSQEDFDSLKADVEKQLHDLDVQLRNLIGMTDDELTAKLEREIAEFKGTKSPAAAFCPSCGKALNVDDRFCPACGQKMGKPNR